MQFIKHLLFSYESLMERRGSLTLFLQENEISMGLYGTSLIGNGTINSIALLSIHAIGYFLNPRYHYRAQFGEDQTGEVKDGLYECFERMVSNETQQLEIHQQISSFTRATGTFGKNLGKIARDVDQPNKQFQF